MTIPTTLPTATEQAKAATQAALEAGLLRIQVEMAIPELKHQPIAEQFLSLFEGKQFKVLFPDAGAAALARRDWSNPDFTIRGLGELVDPVEPDDDLYLIVNPSSVEVAKVEELCNAAIDQPVLLLNPKLEDVAIVGIGYAARQLRDRFLSQIETCYYIRAVDQGAVYRCYPGPWQVWRETAPEEYDLAASFASRPSGEDIERVLYSEGTSEKTSEQADDLNKGIPSGERTDKSDAKTTRKKGLFSELQAFLKALSQ
ncbi:MAG: DUF1995 family protein [Cyanobacteria bacterium J06560_2]